MGCDRPSPLKKNLVPEIPKLRTKEIGKLGLKVVFTFPCCFFFGVVAPLDFVILDVASPGSTVGFIKDANRSFLVGQVLVEVDGAMINILEHIRLVGNLQTLPELGHMKNIVHF
jgi:hypothetical protein